MAYLACKIYFVKKGMFCNYVIFYLQICKHKNKYVQKHKQSLCLLLTRLGVHGKLVLKNDDFNGMIKDFNFNLILVIMYRISNVKS